MNTKSILVKGIVFFIVSTPQYLRATKSLGEYEKDALKMETTDYKKPDYNSNLLTFKPQNRKIEANQRHRFGQIDYERIPGKGYETNGFNVFSSGTEETPMYYDSVNNGYSTTNKYSELEIGSYPNDGEPHAYDYSNHKGELNLSGFGNFERLPGHYVSGYDSEYGNVGYGSYGYHSVDGMSSPSVFCRISWILRKAFTDISNKISLSLRRAFGKISGLKIFFAILAPLIIVFLLAPLSFGQLFLPVALVTTNVQGKRKRNLAAEYEVRSDYNQFLIQRFQQMLKPFLENGHYSKPTNTEYLVENKRSLHRIIEKATEYFALFKKALYGIIRDNPFKRSLNDTSKSSLKASSYLTKSLTEIKKFNKAYKNGINRSDEENNSNEIWSLVSELINEMKTLNETKF